MGNPFTSWYNTEDHTMSDRNVGDRFMSLSSTQRKVVSHWLANFLASRLLSSPPFRAFRTVAGWTVILGLRFAIPLPPPQDGPWIDHLLLLEIQRALRRNLQCGQGNEALRRLGHHVNCIQGVIPGIPRTVPRNPLVHELLEKRRLPRRKQNTPSLEHGRQHLLEPAALRPRQSRVRGNGDDGHEDRRLPQ